MNAGAISADQVTMERMIKDLDYIAIEEELSKPKESRQHKRP